MSISYNIYNTDPEFADMSKWECDHVYPIDIPERVMEVINNMLLPRTLSWNYIDTSAYVSSTPYIGSYSALATDNCGAENEYVDLSLTVHEKGYVCEISARKGSPNLVKMLMEKFGLRYVFEMQSCRLMDPYLYNENWKLSDDKY